MKRNGVELTIPDNISILAQRQSGEDERAYLTDAVVVKYVRDGDFLLLQMQSGVVVQIPRRLIDELATVSAETLEAALTVGTVGEVISARSLDVDIWIPGLLRDLFGFNIQRMGGLAKSEAKAQAARANGAKGGRPRLQRA